MYRITRISGPLYGPEHFKYSPNCRRPESDPRWYRCGWSRLSSLDWSSSPLNRATVFVGRRQSGRVEPQTCSCGTIMCRADRLSQSVQRKLSAGLTVNQHPQSDAVRSESLLQHRTDRSPPPRRMHDCKSTCCLHDTISATAAINKMF